MTELPRLFNDAAEFVEPDAASVAALSGELLKALDDIRSTPMAQCKKPKRNVEGAPAQDEITEALAQVGRAEAAVRPFGPYGRFDLWEQSVKGI